MGSHGKDPAAGGTVPRWIIALSGGGGRSRHDENGARRQSQHPSSRAPGLHPTRRTRVPRADDEKIGLSHSSASTSVGMPTSHIAWILGDIGITHFR